MRKFLTKSFFVVSPILVLIVLTEFFAGKELNLYNRKKQTLSSHCFARNVFGSSHAFYGIKTDGENSFNFGWSSQTLDEAAYLISKLHNTPENEVFLTISPFTFRSTNKNRIESHRNVLFNRTFDASMARSVKDISFIASYGGRTALKMSRNGFNGIGLPQCDPTSGFGYRPGFSSEPIEKSAAEAAERHTRYPLNQRLPDIIQGLANGNIKLNLVTTPFHSSYRDLVKMDSCWIFTQQFCAQLAQSYPNVHYFNCSDFPLPDSCFWDADHLNEHGALLFTNELFRRVSNLQ